MDELFEQTKTDKDYSLLRKNYANLMELYKESEKKRKFLQEENELLKNDIH